MADNGELTVSEEAINAIVKDEPPASDPPQADEVRDVEQAAATEGGEPAAAEVLGDPPAADESVIVPLAEPPVAKADEMEDADKSPNETVAAALVSAIQSLRSVAGEMDSTGLQHLASLMDYARWNFGESQVVADELAKCDDTELLKDASPVDTVAALLEMAVDRLAKKQEPQPEPVPVVAEAIEPVAKSGEPEPDLQPEPPPPRSILSQAGELFAKRQADRVAAKKSELESVALQRISSLADRVQENLNRVQALGKRIDKVIGKAD